MLDPGKLAADAAADQDETQLGRRSTDLLVGQLRRLLFLKDVLAEAEEEVKRLRNEYDELRKDKLPSLLHEAGISSFKLPTGESCYLTSDLYVSVRKEDQPKLYAWLRERGMDSVVSETVHYQTLRAVMRELKEQGERLPDFVGYHPFEKVNVRTK